MQFISKPSTNWRGKIELSEKDWDDVIDLIRYSLKKQKKLRDDLIQRKLIPPSNVGIITYINGIGETVDVSELSDKIDLILDHLDLEYEPKHKCGPSLKPKQKED